MKVKKVRKYTFLAYSSLACILFAPLTHALGLGNIRLHSHLNEPLSAEINLKAINDVPLDQIITTIASSESYGQTGLTQPNWLHSIRFSVVNDPITHKKSIKILTQEPIKDPFADLLIEVVWPGGKLVKEYTLLFDPAPTVTTPAVSVARNQKEKSSTTTKKASITSRSIHPGANYGPVYNETLWSIATKLVENTPFSINQGVAAIAHKNPEAFKDGNINVMQEGAVLKLPTTTEINHFSEANADEVRDTEQNTVTRPSASSISPKIHGELMSEGSTAQRLSKIEEVIYSLKRINEEIEEKNQHLQNQLSLKENEVNRLKIAQTTPANSKVDIAQNKENEKYAVATQHAEIKSTAVNHNAVLTPPAPSLMEAPKDIRKIENKINKDNTAIMGSTEHAVPVQVKHRRRELFFIVGGLVLFCGIFSGLVYFRRHRLSMTTAEEDLKLPKDENTSKMILEEGQVIDPLVNYGVAIDLDKAISAISLQEKQYLISLEKENNEENTHKTTSALNEIDVYIAYEKYAEAQLMLREVIEQHPDEWEAQLKLLELYVLTEQYSEFDKSYSKIPYELKDISPGIWSKMELLKEKIQDEKTAKVIKNSEDTLSLAEKDINGPIETTTDFADLSKSYPLKLAEDDKDASKNGLEELLPDVTTIDPALVPKEPPLEK